MAKGKRRFYAVRRGHRPGVYHSWEECSVQVLGFPSADHKSFSTESEAQAYLREPDATPFEKYCAKRGIEPKEHGANSAEDFETIGNSEQSGSGRDLDSQPPKRRAILEEGEGGGFLIGIQKSDYDGAGSLSNCNPAAGLTLRATKVEECEPGVSSVSQKGLADEGFQIGLLNKGAEDFGVGSSGTVPIGAATLMQKAESTSEEPLYTLEFDGASKGNPGPAGAGAVLRKSDGTIVEEVIEYVGPRATNNAAEYRGLIIGLKAARARGIQRLHAKGDSKLVVYQMRGLWGVHHVDMMTLNKEAQEVAASFHEFTIEHVLREYNSVADGLANIAVTHRQHGDAPSMYTKAIGGTTYLLLSTTSTTKTGKVSRKL